MSRLHRTASSSALLLVVLLPVSACAAVPAAPAPSSSDAPVGQSLGSLAPAPPESDVIAIGTVIDSGGEVEVCLGAVMESFPPQCLGTPLAGWSWAGLDGLEESGDTRWGSYAVTGSYDGDTVIVTGEPVLLALYDPIAAPDPTGGKAGSTSESDLLAIQQDVDQRLTDTGLLGTSIDQGYLWVDVVWDDGTLQKTADDDFGSGVVIIRSALREIE